MTKQRATALAAKLDLDLRSHGVCPACLSFIAFEVAGDERRVAGEITAMAPNLWAEGLGDSVRASLECAVSHWPAAQEGLRELDVAGMRSRVFRAVVRRLAVELAEGARRAYQASLN